MIDTDTVNRFKDGHLIKHYLLASYCYYHLDESPMTDAAYDRLCVRLAGRWSAIDENAYPQKRVISKGDVDAGTCLLPEKAFPSIVRDSAPTYGAAFNHSTSHAALEPFLMPCTPNRVSTKRILRTRP